MDNIIALVDRFLAPLAIFLSNIFVFAIALVLIVALVLYIIDLFQTTHTIRRNYPLLGRFRYLFESLGEFFRQYFFSMDREEMPFNRAQRSWVYRASKNLENTQAFGSTYDIAKPGNILFINSPYPVLTEELTPIKAITFGPDCEQPYSTSSLFNVSGMSYGAISKPAVRALSKGAAIAGCWINTGEGGISDWHLEGGCDIVFQIGTANYGIRNAQGEFCEDKLSTVAAHESVKMIELKLSQGAKPGKGGILPGAKVTKEIAKIRQIPIGETSNSPNRHIDIGNDDELLDKINRIRSITGKPVGFKAVLGDGFWLDQLLSTINQRGAEFAPDFITVDSGDGGTGAAPLTLIDDMGLDIQETLPILVDKLIEFGLRNRIKVIASGKLINPADVAWALCAGADAVTSARGFMFSLGCIQAMQCNTNTCPTGITTHDTHLQRGLVVKEKCKRVAHYQQNMVKELYYIANSCGVSDPGLFNRRHARLILQSNKSISLENLYQKNSE
ncbi:MAG: FMN-binding glutamate synthase family protein [Gammaproteobacteria bacterium]|nr:FMN-binding glutamate synthase family protein [Gammaproteobacteria bacterium]